MSKSRPPKRKPKSVSPSSSLLLNVPKELLRINELIAASDFEQAVASLNDLVASAPHRADIFETMLVLGTKTRDANLCLEATSRLVEIQPYAATNHYNLLVVYLQNGFPALALRTGIDFLRRWPDHKHGIELPQLLRDVRQSLLEERLVAQFPEERRLEILELHDQALLAIMRSNYE